MSVESEIRARNRSVEMSIAAVRREDVEAVETEFRRIRDRYARGGSSIGFGSVAKGTVIR